MWHTLIPIDTPVMEPQNEFTGAGAPTVPDDSDVQVPVKHYFSNTFERDESDGKFVGNGGLNNLVTHLFKLPSHNVFYFILYCHFYT